MVVEGEVCAEVHQVFSPWVSQVLRVYKHDLALEMDWLVGPIPIDDHKGREVVTRVVFPDMTTNNTFFTDSNGREMLRRVNDYRETWVVDNQEPVAGNYYPVNSRIIIQDANDPTVKAALLNDRSQVSRAIPGLIHVLVSRRLYD